MFLLGKKSRDNITIEIEEKVNPDHIKKEIFEEYFLDLHTENMDITKKIDNNKGGSLGELINNIMGKIHSSIKGIICQMVDISTAAFNLGHSVDKLKVSLIEQSNIIDGISDSANKLSNDILNISKKTELLKTQSLNAKDSTISGNARMLELNDYLNNVGVDINGTKEFMKSLKSSTQSIHILTEMIDDITSKLDILSINASIEAARAGNAGNGFSVIAKEIRNLSSKSGSAVNKVNTIVDTVIKDMADVDGSLNKAELRIKDCQNKSSLISSDFSQINRTNTELNDEIYNISMLLNSQETSSKDIKNLTQNLNNHAKPILAQTQNTELMSHKLHKTVDKVLETATFKLDWHNVAINSLIDIKSKIKSIKEDDLVSFLNRQFVALPYIELFYVMDIKGIQITSNIVNPRFLNIICSNGKFEDRSQKEYVKNLLEDETNGFVSGIYISSASRDLCVTVSVLINGVGEEKVILATDMNIKDFINL